MEGLAYARKLADKFSVFKTGLEISIELQFYIPASLKLDATNVNAWKGQF